MKGGRERGKGELGEGINGRVVEGERGVIGGGGEWAYDYK